VFFAQDGGSKEKTLKHRKSQDQYGLTGQNDTHHDLDQDVMHGEGK
jgi:hypothetical protein